jgi:integrase
MREAQAYLTKKLRERDLGGDLQGAKITLNEYLDRWLQTAVKPRVRQKTWQDYDGILRRYIRPGLGDRVLVSMRPMGIQASYQRMIERGLSARTIRYTHAVLRSALRQAMRWCLLLENPVDGVKLPQQVRGEMRSLTVQQAQSCLRAALATRHGPVLAVALTTGMRPSEYLALKWQDLDWPRQTVSVVRSIRRVDGRWCFCDTKRSRGRRPIKLQSWMVALLRDSAGGSVPRMRLYDLRHSAATIALAAGVSPKVVSEQLGHASTAFTLDTYAHVLPHIQDEAAARVEAMLFRQTA